MWWSFFPFSFSLQQFFVLLKGLPAKEDGRTDVFEVFSKSLDLLLDLIGEFFHVSDDEGRAGIWVAFIEPLKEREDEYSGFSHSRFGLAQNIGPVDRSGNALLLNFIG